MDLGDGEMLMQEHGESDEGGDPRCLVEWLPAG